MNLHDNQVIGSNVRRHIQGDTHIQELSVSTTAITAITAAITAITAAITATITATPLIRDLLSVKECRRDSVAGLNTRSLQHLGRAAVGKRAHGKLEGVIIATDVGEPTAQGPGPEGAQGIPGSGSHVANIVATPLFRTGVEGWRC